MSRLEPTPILETEELHIKTFPSEGGWGIRIRARPLHFQNQENKVLDMAFSWGAQHWAIEITHQRTNESFLFELVKKDLKNKSGVYGPGEGSCYWDRYGFMEAWKHPHLQLGCLAKDWDPTRVRKEAQELLKTEMPNYYLGAADCQWFCVTLLHRITDRDEYVETILNVAKEEGAKMFSQVQIPLRRAYTFPHDLTRNVIKTIKVTKATGKWILHHSPDHMLEDMPHIVSHIISSGSTHGGAQATADNEDSGQYHHHHHYLKNGAKALISTIAHGVTDFAQEHHVGENIKRPFHRPHLHNDTHNEHKHFSIHHRRTL